MADCGTELRTVAAATAGCLQDTDKLLIIGAQAYSLKTFVDLKTCLATLYAALNHNHNLQDLEDVSGDAEDGQILMFDIGTGKVTWVTPTWMPAGSNFDDRYQKLSPAPIDFMSVAGQTRYPAATTLTDLLNFRFLVSVDGLIQHPSQITLDPTGFIQWSYELAAQEVKIVFL